MSDNSKIEWTDTTWNIVRGCDPISAGCKNCYAMRFAERWRGVPGHPFEQGFDLRLIPEKLTEPLRWKRSRKIFVCSMSDLFHQNIPDDFIVEAFQVMASANWHTFQVLTKRSGRLWGLLNSKLKFVAEMPHIWWGVSVENRRQGLPRIDHLRTAGVALRFLSIEPLLQDLGEINLAGIGWVIVGGESGPGARQIKADWVRSIRDQCQAADVPFFFKQWGGSQRTRNGRMLDGISHDAFPDPDVSASAPPLRDRQKLIDQFNLLHYSKIALEHQQQTFEFC